MNLFNAIMNTVGNIVLAPLSFLSPLMVLIVVSLVSGIAMTIVFRYTSNQSALRRVAANTKAQIQCLRIFKDDLGVAIRCQGDLIKAIGLRLWHSLPPAAILIIPFVIIIIQLAQRYEVRPLRPGESVITAVEIAPDDWKQYHDDISIQVPPGVTVQTPPLHDAGNHTVYWRLKMEEPTDGSLRWSVGRNMTEKSLLGTENTDRLYTVNPRRAGPGFWDRLLYPVEPAFGADSPVRSIDVRYPKRSTPVFGLDVPWWATFIVLSMVAALLVRPFLKVQF